ncbi:MAG: UvrD-helicase domain-containing protein, partial [Sulfobacillus sp.]
MADRLTSSSGGVRIRSNVIAVQLDSERLSDQDLVKRLTYWELLELSRSAPMRFPSSWTREEALTDRQKAEKDGFMRPAQDHALHLWSDIPETFRPMPITKDPSRFPRPSNAKPTSNPRPSITTEPFKVNAQPLETIEDPPTRSATPDDKRKPSDLSAFDVLQSSISSRFLVLAPPGTGKTHLMLDRLTQLIQTGDLRDPHAEILVLSFTRATVSDISRKLLERVLEGAPDDVRYVDVRTFDSLATTLLLLEDNAEDYLIGDYDARIKLVTEGLTNRRLVESQDRLSRVRYLVIDEVQDLTGVRAEFCLSMMRHLAPDSGILLLGDPAQAIYDFNTEHWTADLVLGTLRKHLAPHLQTASLSRYYRFQDSALERLAVDLRTAIEYEELSLRFVPTLTQSIPKQSLNELAVAASESRVAVLTRTNLEAFQLSEWARSQRIETVVRVRQSYWPAWMARLLFGLRGDYISSAHLRSLWKHHGLEGVGNIAYEDAETLWEESGLFRRGSLDLVAVGDYLRSHVPAPELDKPGLVVTTIHQSKGLEYDSVALLAPTTHANLGGQADELRVLYVAATRAKRHLSLLERDGKIFRWGKKGQKSIYNHFHRYTNLENWFLLNTKESFSFKNFWYCPPAFSRSQWIQRIEQTQQDWWDQFKIDGH